MLELSPSLYPGQNGDATFWVANPNAALTVVGITRTGVITSDNEAGCPASNVTFANQADGTLSIPLAQGVSVVTVPGVVSMAATAPSTFQGATFTIAVDIHATT